MTHTPGPWIVFNGGVSVWANGGYIKQHFPEAPRDERHANARLIAAAPELLEACKLAEDILAMLDFEEGTFEDRAKETIQKAIDKAGGAL